MKPSPYIPFEYVAVALGFVAGAASVAYFVGVILKIWWERGLRNKKPTKAPERTQGAESGEGINADEKHKKALEFSREHFPSGVFKLFQPSVLDKYVYDEEFRRQLDAHLDDITKLARRKPDQPQSPPQSSPPPPGEN